jgi:CRP-like cAMP-binding protein
MSQPSHLSHVGHPGPIPVVNRLLRTLSGDDLALLKPHLEFMSLERGDVLIQPNQPIAHVFFPEGSIGSVVANTPEGRRIEVGIFGREGMSGTAVLLGTDRTPHETFIQVPGSALRIGTADLRRVIRESPSLHEHLLRYVQAFQVQVSQTALSHGSYTIEERLARWLLMCHDRLDGDDLPLIHEFLSLMLGVQRSGVTAALQSLEAGGMIRAQRGLITITDRAKLEEVAGGSYGISEAEHRRLIGAL